MGLDARERWSDISQTLAKFVYAAIYSLKRGFFGFIFNWTVVHSCRLFEFEQINVAAAVQADFGGEEFLEDEAFG